MLVRSGLLPKIRELLASAAIVITLILAACQGKRQSPDEGQLGAVRDSVQVFASTVAHEVTREGPRAWLRFFSHSPEFFMASQGKLVFPTIDSASVLVEYLAVQVRSIQLTWADMSVDPLSPQLAGFRASFHEIVTERSGQPTPIEGFCTATVEHTGAGWRFRNLHWSIVGKEVR